MKIERINQIKEILSSVPPSPWAYCPGDDVDHWEIYSIDGTSMVQDDDGVPPDNNFINFVLMAKSIIEELLKEVNIED